jgi:hypothetical protein
MLGCHLNYPGRLRDRKVSDPLQESNYDPSVLQLVVKKFYICGVHTAVYITTIIVVKSRYGFPSSLCDTEDYVHEYTI